MRRREERAAAAASSVRRGPLYVGRAAQVYGSPPSLSPNRSPTPRPIPAPQESLPMDFRVRSPIVKPSPSRSASKAPAPSPPFRARTDPSTPSTPSTPPSEDLLRTWTRPSSSSPATREAKEDIEKLTDFFENLQVTAITEVEGYPKSKTGVLPYIVDLYLETHGYTPEVGLVVAGCIEGSTDFYQLKSVLEAAGFGEGKAEFLAQCVNIAFS